MREPHNTTKSTTMTAKALADVYQCVGEITDGWAAAIPANHKKSISSIVGVIKLATNSDSVEESRVLVDKLAKVQDTLPIEELDVLLAKQHLDFVNEHLTEINELMDFIKYLFDNNDKVEIDDDNMFSFLANMQTAQSMLTYISSYLNLVLKVNKSKSEPSKDFTLDTLLEHIAA